MTTDNGREKLDKQLAEIQREISQHPFSDPEILGAQKLIENYKSLEPAEIDRRLSDEGLPSLETLGKNQLRHSFSWWNLHRKKRKVEAKISRFNG